MTTVDEIVQRVLNPLRDSTQEFFGEPEMIDYMNQAVTDLCTRQRLFRSQTTLTTGSSHLDMADDMLQVRWVKNPDGIEVGWLDESTFFDYQITFPDWDPTTPLATIYDDAIWLHPTVADGESWVVGYYGLPAVLTAGSDTFPLRRQWEEKAVRYIRSECWYKLGEPQMARDERALYEEGLRPSEAMTDRQVPGKLNFSREPNVFDTDPESIHLGG